MVVSLPKPGVCSLNMVDALVAERQGGKNAGFFNGIAAEWKQRVDAYITNSGSPAVVPVWPAIAPQGGTFLNLYSKPADGSAQGLMLASLRDHQLRLCPACGEAGSPNTLDHYLPKAKYPHFCVTPLNLFPMCDACQLAKGEKTGNAVSPRFFIHPYFDTFVVDQVVTLSIDAPFDTPTFSLLPQLGLTGSKLSLVQTHLEELEIHDRYARFFRNEYRRLLRLVDRIRKSHLNVQEHLELFRGNASDTSLNAWEHVFYSGVLANDDLIKFLESSLLPELL